MFTRRRKTGDLSEEIRAHIELEAARLMEEGLSEAEAWAHARRTFGNVTATEERFHERKRWIWADGLVKDLFYALRRLKKNPAFSVAAVLLLALGIGSNVAVFRLIGALFLSPIPVDRPEELVNIATLDKEGQVGGIPSTVLDPLRKEAVLQGVCGFTTPRLTTEINGGVNSTGTLAMTGDCFSTLGLTPQLGRSFTLSEDSDAVGRVALLTDSLWRSAYGARPDVLGQSIKVQGSLFTIIGVTDSKFTGVLLGFPPGLIIPLHQIPLDQTSPTKHAVYFWGSIFGRRARGMTDANVSARIQVIEKQLLEQSVPSRYNQAQRRDYMARRLVVVPARTGVDWMLRNRFGQPLYVILGICVSVLLIACVNLAGLLLARGLSRRQEIAIRLSLGASRGRVARLTAAESVIIVAAGSLAGLLVAALAVRVLLLQASRIFSNFHVNADFNSYAAIFTGGIILLTALFLCAVPVWQTGRLDNSRALKSGGRSIMGTSTTPQRLLLSFEIALTLAMVASSGLFTSSLHHVYEQNLGIDTRGLSEASLSPLPGGYGSQPLAPYYGELLERIQSLPDVRSAALADFAPFWTMQSREPVSMVEGAQGRGEILAHGVRITDRFLETAGLRILAGEGFRREDERSTEMVAMVSEPLAKLLGGDRIIGSHIRAGTGQPYQNMKVIGIVSNAQMSLVDPAETEALMVYISFWQHPQGYQWLLVKTESGREIPSGIVRSVVRSFGRDYVETWMPATQAKDDALVENRLLAYLSAAFAGLALLLAAVGLFGLLSYHVISRTNEIGIRMALGAGRAQIRGLIARQILVVAIGGIAGGVALTLAIGPLIRSFVYGIGVHDLRMLALAIVVMILTAATAAWIPAHRAASLDPMKALRQE